MIRSKAIAVGVAAQDAQVGQGVLDLATLVEAGPADQLVADPVAQERLLDRPALGVGPVHHGDVAGARTTLLVVGLAGQQRASPADQGFDLSGDPLGFLLLVVRLETLDRPATGLLGPQLLVLARRVPADDSVGGIEDQLGRAVVLLELDHGGTRLVALEVEDVAQVGAAPRVDRLVVVADHAQVVMARGEGPNPQVLGAVRVLVLVHVEVAPAFLVAGEDGGDLVEQSDRVEQDVVEVESAQLCEAGLVDPGQPGDLAFVVVQGALGQGSAVEHLVLGPADCAQDGGRPKLAGGRQVLFLEDLLHQGLLVVAVVDHEAPIESDGRPIAPERPGTDGMERPALDLASGFADEGDDALAELARRAIGEGHGQDLPGPHAEHADQVGDPMGQDPGLAAAGPGQDQQRSVGRGHRPRLFRIQTRHDLLGQGSRRGRVGPGLATGLGFPSSRRQISVTARAVAASGASSTPVARPVEEQLHGW